MSLDSAKVSVSTGRPPPVKKEKMLDWWVSIVLFAFLPVIFAIIMSLIKHGSVDFVKMIGDGELIISSFLIIATPVATVYIRFKY